MWNLSCYFKFLALYDLFFVDFCLLDSDPHHWLELTRQESSKALFIYSSHVSLGGPGCIGWAWWNTVIPTSAPQPGWIPHRSDQPLLKQDPDTSQWKTTTTNNTRNRQVWSWAVPGILVKLRVTFIFYVDPFRYSRSRLYGQP